MKIKLMKSKFRRLMIERIDKERLFQRGGIGIRVGLSETTLAIVGCGSLGSQLAISLSKTGLSKFLLVDKELIEAENVARHVCGFMEAGNNKPKSKAIQNRLITHFPHIDCEAHHSDILDLLRKDESLLNGYDLIIMAIANMSVEIRLNHLLRRGKITSPLLFLWLEPLGVAGQILYIHPTEGGCYECCLTNEGHFRYSVSRPNQGLHKREAGCQSTFVQYSNLDVEHFLAIAAKEVVRFLENPPASSILKTWLGDINLFKSLGHQISDEWLADFSYSIHQKTIQKNSICRIC